MEDDIGSPFDRIRECRRRDRVVDNERQFVFMRELGKPLDVDNIQLRISDRFRVDRLRAFVYRGLDA